MLIGSSPTQFDTSAAIELATMPDPSLIEEGEDGTHMVLGRRETITHLRIEPDVRRWGCILLPFEPDSRTRNRAAQWLALRLDGDIRGPSPEALWDSPARRAHLHCLLRLFDGASAGVPLREMAAVFVDTDATSLSAAAWIDSAERKRLRRWLAQARRLVDGGYRGLLAGP